MKKGLFFNREEWIKNIELLDVISVKRQVDPIKATAMCMDGLRMYNLLLNLHIHGFYINHEADCSKYSKLSSAKCDCGADSIGQEIFDIMSEQIKEHLT